MTTVKATLRQIQTDFEKIKINKITQVTDQHHSLFTFQSLLESNET